MARMKNEKFKNSTVEGKLRKFQSFHQVEFFRAFPSYVRERIRSTYMVFGSGLAVTAATAVTLARRPHRMGRVLNTLGTPMGAIGAMAGCFARLASVFDRLKQIWWFVCCYCEWFDATGGS